jgi:pilus assembly protein Flp/PilA
MIKFLKNIYLSEKGATAIEYGLIVALIALAIIVAISGVGNSTGNMWNFVSGEVIKSSTFD